MWWLVVDIKEIQSPANKINKISLKMAVGKI